MSYITYKKTVFKRNAHENQCLTLGKIYLCEYDEKGLTKVLHNFSRWRCTDFERAANTLDGDLYLSLDRNGVHLRSLNRLKYLRLVIGHYSERIQDISNVAFIDHESKIAIIEPNGWDGPPKKYHILDLETNKFLHNLTTVDAHHLIPQYVEEINNQIRCDNYIEIDDINKITSGYD